jgi:ABC-type multidrug transport system ATPase subunit
MEAKVEERERREKEIEGRQKEIAHHQKFVDRFRAKASKARQAQSKLRMIEKKADELEELPGSSRRYPKFRFSQRRPSGREVLKIRGIKKAYGDNEVLHGVDLEVKRGDRLVMLGPNGIGKSTLLKILVGQLEPDAGTVEWGHETHPGYFAQDHHEQLEESSRTVEEWLWDYCPGRDRGFVRGHLGLMLFSGDDADKPLTALSGGEAARMVFSRLALEQPNVLVLDEPTNHLDLESIEALVAGLQDYDGTLILVSHDRWFVSRLATRVVEITASGILDYPGTYEEYVHACGDDHLDVDDVTLKTRREERKKASDGTGGNGAAASSGGNGGSRDGDGAGAAAGGRRRERPDPYRLKRLAARRDELMAEIEAAETRVGEIEASFAEPAFYDRTTPATIQALEEERASLKARAEGLVAEWEDVAREVEAAT